MGASKLINVGSVSIYEEQISKLADENKLLKEFISESIMDSNKYIKKENEELKVKIGNLEGQLQANKESYDKYIKKSRDIMRGQREESELNLMKEISNLKRLVADKDNLINKLNDKSNQLNDELNNKEELLIKQQIKLESREKEIEMLENVIEGITGIKVDTENIIDKLSVLDNITLDIDYDKLMDKLNTDGSLIVLSKDEAKSLIDIIIKNKNYLIKSTTGKGLVFDEDELKRNILIAYEYIDNGNKCTLKTATKFGFNSTPALSSKMNTIKKNYFDLIAEYKLTGLTDKLIEKYGEKLSDVIELLKNKEEWEQDWLNKNK